MNRFIGLNRPTLDSDLVSFSCGFNYHIVLFQADNNPDDTADCRDLITNLNAASHLLSFFVFFLLRTNQNEIENDQD